MAKLLIYTDGGARGNPGPAAVGIVIKTQSASRGTEKVHSFGKKIGNATNNYAEYLGVIEALRYFIDNQNKFSNLTSIEIFLDSSLVVNQLNGKFKVKNQDLINLFYTVRDLENKINKTPKYFLIPRTDNLEADFLVNKALDNK
ncbi:MAG: ribonuclease HI family protein [Patescibacteria group bacterium]|nr:ribonuclease HI family protein [Patescibacteria group bacterium]